MLCVFACLVSLTPCALTESMGVIARHGQLCLHITWSRCPDSTRPETMRPCHLPCKKDCVVTAFSEWTPCPRLCKSGNATTRQSRYRIINQEAANGGRECPDTLFEERECEEVSLCPIYRWRPQKWSPCVLVPESVRQGIMSTSEACGKGVQTRDGGAKTFLRPSFL
uniref:Thrombospondin type 1 domain containing 7B n=1 Tax=Molossus molossus TaxID=27622 RepID=A0A7J8FU38_MOLMO|nr:thrombospondin type 1 domain containing 7B [Molossus molossus]